jgi:hypothetical protein
LIGKVLSIFLGRASKAGGNALLRNSFSRITDFYDRKSDFFGMKFFGEV